MRRKVAVFHPSFLCLFVVVYSKSSALIDRLQRELNPPRRKGAGDLALAAGEIAVRVKSDDRRVDVRRGEVGAVEKIESL